jgi:glycosyltransferase involved in cell wall biosynthesis
VVAYLGRLVEEKGLRVLLDAYRRLPVRASTSLLCIGGGPLGDECRREPGTVVVDGLRHSDVPKYLALADLAVLPSLTTLGWKEQFGRAAIEAMALGLPVIGSDSGEIPNVLNATGGGVIVPEGDADSLRDALVWLLEDSEARERFGERGRNQVRKEYSTRAVAGRLATALGLTHGTEAISVRDVDHAVSN